MAVAEMVWMYSCSVALVQQKRSGVASMVHQGWAYIRPGAAEMGVWRGPCPVGQEDRSRKWSGAAAARAECCTKSQG